jgi:hypothetical protein
MEENFEKKLENLLNEIQKFSNEVRFEYDLGTMKILVCETEKEFWEKYYEFHNENGNYAKFLEYKEKFKDIDNELSNENKNVQINEIIEKIYNEFDYISYILDIYRKQLRENEIDYGLKRIKKYKNIFQKQKVQIENLKKNYKEISNEQREHDKKILEMMGIFLTIFSVIGFGVSSITKENANISTVFMIYGVILMTISGLFYLINFDKNFKEKFLKISVPLLIGILLVVFGKYIL